VNALVASWSVPSPPDASPPASRTSSNYVAPPTLITVSVLGDLRGWDLG